MTRGRTPGYDVYMMNTATAAITAARHTVTSTSPTTGQARQFKAVTVTRDGETILRRSRWADAASATVAIVRLADNACWLASKRGPFYATATASPDYAVADIDDLD